MSAARVSYILYVLLLFVFHGTRFCSTTVLFLSASCGAKLFVYICSDIGGLISVG